MVNTCRLCGDLVAEGNVCYTCENVSDPGVKCPTCGEILELMDSSWYFTSDGIGCSVLFHCNACHDDFEKEIGYKAKPVIFKHKYWG